MFAICRVDPFAADRRADDRKPSRERFENLQPRPTPRIQWHREQRRLCEIDANIRHVGRDFDVGELSEREHFGSRISSDQLQPRVRRDVADNGELIKRLASDISLEFRVSIKWPLPRSVSAADLRLLVRLCV